MIIIKAEIYNSYDMMKANAFTMIITKAEIYNSILQNENRRLHNDH